MRFLLFSFLLLAACRTEARLENEIVEAGCGQCMFDMPGEGCHLAIRVNGKGYWVDGTGIDEHGDAHGEDGFCNAVRQARVSGTVSEDRIQVTAFEVLPTATSN